MGMSRKLYHPAHPGQIVKDLIDEAGLNITAAAERLGVSRQQLTRLLGEKSGISPEMALRLEAVFGSTAEAWLRMQNAWELAQVRSRVGDIVAGLQRISGDGLQDQSLTTKKLGRVDTIRPLRFLLLFVNEKYYTSAV